MTRETRRVALKPVFVDSSYVIAFFFPRDKYHARARAANERLKRTGATKAITTEAVLTEIANALARAATRDAAIRILAEMRADPNLEVLPVDAVLFDHAVSLYGARADKEWSLTDCLSFVVMQRRGLVQALTADRHFEQAGFQLAM